MKYRDHLIHYMYGSRVAVSYVFDGDFLLVALMPQTLKDVLDNQDRSGFRTLADSEKFKKAIGSLPSGFSYMEYSDSEAAFGALYNIALPFLLTMNAERSNPFDMALLPPESHLRKYMLPSGSILKRTEGGILSESYSSGSFSQVPVTIMILAQTLLMSSSSQMFTFLYAF